MALSCVVNVLDPDVIVIGGSISNAYEFFYEAMTETLKKHINSLPSENLKTVRSQLNTDKSFLGAACLVLPML